jgi:hypothetical protein
MVKNSIFNRIKFRYKQPSPHPEHVEGSAAALPFPRALPLKNPPQGSPFANPRLLKPKAVPDAGAS